MVRTTTRRTLAALALLLLLPPVCFAQTSGAWSGTTRLLYGPDAHRDDDRPDAPPPRPFPGPSGGLTGDIEAPLPDPGPDDEPPAPPPAPARRAPELSGNACGVYAFQELDPALFAGYLETCDGAPLDERKRRHVGFTLSAWVKIGTDEEFDSAARCAGPETDGIAANNRLVVAFEQFSPDGARQAERRAKFGFEVDLFGNVYPCVAASDGSPWMVAGGTSAEDQTVADFPEITSCAVVLVNPVRRMCAVGKYRFEYLPEAKEPSAAPAVPTSALLQRWKRLFIHFYPEVGPGGLAPHPDGEDSPPPRYAVSIYPKAPDDPAAPRLTHFVDGAMFQISRYPTQWTPDKTFYLGPTEDFTNGALRDTSLLPIHTEIPYETK